MDKYDKLEDRQKVATNKKEWLLWTSTVAVLKSERSKTVVGRTMNKSFVIVPQKSG
jgi:hypothetical protein